MLAKYMWNVLPSGAAPNATTGSPILRLSVFVSPRLDPETDPPVLESFGADLGPNLSFTELAQMVAMNFTFGTGAGAITLPAALVNAGDGALDPTLWPQVFPPDTYVEGFQYDSPGAARLISFPVEAVHRYMTQLYGTLAVSNPTEFPAIDGSNADLDQLMQILGRVRESARRLEESNQGDTSDERILSALGINSPSAPEAEVAIGFYRAFRFYNRRLHKAEPAEHPFPPEVPDFDFHRQLALLGDYPLLLRKLGLILDYEITDPGVTRLPAAAAVRAAFTPPNNADHRFPPTRYLLDLTVPDFQAEPEAGSELAGGMLDLGPNSPYFVTQTDVDGGALKLIEYAGAMRNRRDMRPNWSEGKTESVPALRSAGVAVVRRQRTQPIQGRFMRNDAINAGFASATVSDVESTPLFADDLVRGYRVDIEDGGQWRSLCQRDGTYRLGTGPTVLGPLSDEGYVKAASVSGESDEPDVAYLHETTFGWSGWSLVAPRPGRTLTMDKDAADPREQTPSYGYVGNTPPAGVQVATELRVTPGTLPRLRFGRQYRVRARAVDLAGNARPLSTPASESFPTQVFTYRRYEPVQQPILVYQHVLSQGEWLENMVIRSDRDVSVVDYIMGPSVVDQGYLEHSQRHCAPPKVPQALAEAHGAFDPEWASEDQTTHYPSYLLALKEAGTFQDREIFDPSSEGLVTVNDIELIDTATTPPEKAGMWPAMRGESLATGQYVIHTGDQVVLPYLPDPVVLGVTFCDPQTGEVWQREWTGAWPFLEPFRIRVMQAAEGVEEPFVDPDGTTVDIHLPQATIWTLRYSCFIKPESLDSMALYAAMQGDQTALEAARMGKHWMLTPYRELKVVHAVQRPLEDPVANVEQDATRAPGQTFARLMGNVRCHARSSGQLDLKAHWIDPVDFVTDDAPTTVFTEAQVVSLKPGYDEDEVPLDPAAHRHELGDTKHRKVAYQAVATTRYREYLPRALWENDSSRITAPEAVLGEPEMEGGDPTFVKETVSVLSTARPDKPKILYALPIFRWERSEDGTEVSRRGGALRVYLDRPWYSSGEGELLAVLLEPSSTGLSEEDVDRYVSQWGSDPIRANLAPQNRLEPGHFLNQAASAEGLSIPEGAENLDLVAFNVQFNTQRKLWYADIELETGAAYFPFLRLSFARYQPESIDGVELSTTVRGELIQVAANRSVVLSRGAMDSVTISLSGPSGANQAGDDEVPAPGGGLVIIPSDVVITQPPPTPSLPLIGRQPAPEIERPPLQLPTDLALPDLMPAGENAGGHVVLARLERRTGDTDFDWERVGGAFALPAFQKMSDLDNLLWSGDLALSQGAIDAPGDHRIVLEEYEVYLTDPDVALSRRDPTVGGARGSGSRLVFVAHLSIPE